MFAPNFGGLTVLLLRHQLAARRRTCRAAQRHDDEAGGRLSIRAEAPPAAPWQLGDRGARSAADWSEPPQFSTQTVPYNEVRANSTWENFKRATGVSLADKLPAAELYPKSIFAYSFPYAHELCQIYPDLFERIDMINFAGQPEGKLMKALEFISSLTARQWAAHASTYSPIDTENILFRRILLAINLLRCNLDVQSKNRLGCARSLPWDSLLSERRARFKVCSQEPRNCGQAN